MYRKELFAARRNALTLALISFALGACLEQTGSSEGFVANSDTDSDAEPSTNTAPAIYGSPDRVITVGDMYRFTPAATDADGDELTFAIRQLLNPLSDAGVCKAINGKAG